MSGHSKWHNIQARKGKQDALRSNVFSKFAKQISIAARQGGGDPEANFSLRLLIDKSKAAGMPKDNIERAVKRGTGEINDGVQIEEATYEAFGPGGTAIVIKVATDNKNRASADVKHILSENGGSMGGAGSVAWMFTQCGLLIVAEEKLAPAGKSREDFEMEMIEVGADDIWSEDSAVYVKFPLADLKRGSAALGEMNIEPDQAGIAWVAKDKVTVDDEARAKLERLFGELEENDDVEDYWTNAE